MSTAWRRHNRSSGRIFRLVFVASVALLAVALAYALDLYNTQTRPLWFITGKVTDHGAYLVYRPDGLTAGQPATLVFALSPSADALAMIAAWSQVAEKHHWLVAASKEFQNGQDFYSSLKQLKAELDDVEKRYPTDPQRVIFTGMSGGGMGAHAFARTYPALVSAVVVNTGMIAPVLTAGAYPTGKLAVLLASPTDFRYHEMQRDRDFLIQHGWQIKWIEFTGGHVVAPAEAYEQAAAWLENRLP
jgi:predicted esterase